MIDAPNTRSQKYLVGVIQAIPGTPVSDEIADIFRNYYIDIIIIIIIIIISLMRIEENSTLAQVMMNWCIISTQGLTRMNPSSSYLNRHLSNIYP